MITITGLTVKGFTFGQRLLTWTIESTTDPISSYELKVYRSEYHYAPNSISNMELVNEHVSADSYSWIDYTVSGLEYDQYRTLYYTVVPRLTGTGDEGTPYGPATLDVVQDKWARNIGRQQAVGIRLTGQPVTILKKKTFGTFCENYDETLGRHTTGHCNICYDTGFTGGYFPISVSGIIDTSGNKNIQTEWGQWQPNDGQLIIMNYPELAPDDVIVDNLAKRWTVVEARGTEKGMYLIMQRAQVRILPKDDIVYEFPLTSTTTTVDWIPSNLAPFLWYRADYGITLATGTNISQWAPKVGDYPLVSMADPNQPTYISGYQNGQPAVQFFNSISGNMSTGLFTTALYQPNTVLMVVRGPTMTTLSRYAFDGITTLGTQAFRANGSYDLLIRSGTDGIAYNGTTNILTYLAVLQVVFNGNHSNLWRNGVQLGSDVVSGGSDMNGFTLGSSATPTLFANMEVCEVLIFNRKLSTTEVASFNTYATARYALT